MDTQFYKSPFVRSLKAPLKLLYSFIVTDCNGAGVWVVDLEAASLYTGLKLSDKDVREGFLSTGKAIDLNNGKWFFPDFIEHQYPSGLQANNPAHKNFILELQKYQLLDDQLKPLKSPFKGSNVTVTVKADVKADVKVKAEVKREKLDFKFCSVQFHEKWNKLIQQPKWKNKSHDALQASLDKLGKQTEEDAIQMMVDSIAGNWQGIFPLRNGQGAKAKELKGKQIPKDQVYTLPPGQ